MGRLYMWQYVKKWVKGGRQRNNYMESEHCSWESLLSLSEEREAVWRGYLFFIWRWKLKSGGESPNGITDWRCTLLGLLSLPSPSFFHSRSLSISHLSDLHQRAATASLGEGSRGEEKEKQLILNVCFTVKLYSLYTPVVCRALLGFAGL